MKANWLSLGILVAVASGCGASDTARSARVDDVRQGTVKQDAPAAKKREVGPLEPTRVLVRRPELAVLVDALAEMKSIESSHVGYAGTKSVAFTRFEQVRDAATEQEIVALLHHESPVVRGYMAQHVATSLGARMREIAHLLDDETIVGTLEGCMGNPGATVASVVRESLCMTEQPEAMTLLDELALGLPADRVFAAECISTRDPAKAARIAHQELRRGGGDAAALLRVLAESPRADACGDVLARASDPDTEVRRAAAQALGSCDSRAAFDALVVLSGDGEARVAQAASAALAVHPRQTLAERGRILSDVRLLSIVVADLSKQMRKKDVKPFLPLVEELALAHPRDAGMMLAGFTGDPADDAVAAMMRRIAAKVPPAASPMEFSVRTHAITFLARKKDAADLGELRRSLSSRNNGELVEAITALGELRDTSSRAAIRALKTGNTPAAVVRAADEALAKL